MDDAGSAEQILDPRPVRHCGALRHRAPLAFVGICVAYLGAALPTSPWFTPVRTADRQSTEGLATTRIGAFGEVRVARPGVPEHLHTGVDILRPTENYDAEPVFPAAAGVVVSMRNDGPLAQVIVRHEAVDGGPVWTVYEHVAGIVVGLGEPVDPARPVARFMNRKELDEYGWQFDHLHFEMMKVAPARRAPDHEHPDLRLATYNLTMRTREELIEKYHDPVEFLRSHWNR